MATERCPVCAVPVKAENLPRHLQAQHPNDAKAAAALETIRKQPKPRDAAKAPSRRFRVRTWHYVAVAVVILVLLAVYLVPRPSATTFDFVNTCGAEGSAEHYHPLLVINHNGVQKPLAYDPAQGADIGYVHDPAYTNPSLWCASGEVHALHTHDGCGIIHVELPVVVATPPTLGDFFTIWGQALGPSAVWTFSGTVHATSYDWALKTSSDYSANPRSIPLTNTHRQLPIPPALIFYDSATDSYPYGSGGSDGNFSGQIIWLNVTA